MPRPRRSQETRAQLIEVGSQLITKKGYAGVGLKEILAEVGVPKGSFYNYFTSKENFAAVVLETYMEGILGLMDSIMAGADVPAIEQLKQFHEALLAFIRTSDTPTGCLLGALAAEVGPNAPEIHATMRIHEAQWLSRYAALLTTAQEQGDVRKDIPADVLASLLWTQWQGALIRLQIDQSVEHLETSFLSMIALIRTTDNTPGHTS